MSEIQFVPAPLAVKTHAKNYRDLYTPGALLFLGLLTWKDVSYDVVISSTVPLTTWRPYMTMVRNGGACYGWVYGDYLSARDEAYDPIKWIERYSSDNWWQLLNN